MPFSKAVTQEQRDAIDHDRRGRAISQCSRQNMLRPGYNPPEVRAGKLKVLTAKATPAKQKSKVAKVS